MPQFVQVCNPRTRRFAKIDRVAGAIVSHKRTKGPYKNILIRGERYDLQDSNKGIGE